MDEVTNNIIGLLKDPETPGEWDRMGLVIGHVQSGKTANYIGLIAKAADAGYRFIILDVQVFPQHIDFIDLCSQKSPRA